MSKDAAGCIPTSRTGFLGRCVAASKGFSETQWGRGSGGPSKYATGVKYPDMEEGRTERELDALREELGAEKARREQAERERDQLLRELEEVRPRGRPWWVLGLLVVVTIATLFVLSLGAILSPP